MRRLAVVLLVLLLVGCGRRDGAAPPGPEHYQGPITPAQRSEIVATVNGQPLHAADLARQMAARGQTAEEALEELVAAELLAQEAFRRGLADDPDVAAQRRRESIRALILREFEPSFDGPEDVLDKDVEAAKRVPRIRRFYDHERLHTVAYARVEADEKKASAAEQAAARARAVAFAAAARAARPATAEAFLELAGAHGLANRAAQLFTTGIDGPAVLPFARAAFSLTRVGEISEAVKTPWGWDVLFLKEIVPEVRMTPAQMEADLRVKLFEGARGEAYTRWVDRLLSRHRVTTRPELLELVQVDSPVGL